MPLITENNKHTLNIFCSTLVDINYSSIQNKLSSVKCNVYEDVNKSCRMRAQTLKNIQETR